MLVYLTGTIEFTAGCYLDSAPAPTGDPYSTFFVSSVRAAPLLFTAFLGYGSHFSGCLSGIKPRIPIARCKHGRCVVFHRQLIRQTFETSVAGTGAVRTAGIYPESPNCTMEP